MGSNSYTIQGTYIDTLVSLDGCDSIINTDQSEYDTYISRRKLRLAEKNKVSSVEEDLANLKGEINEIKSLLKELVNGN